MVHRKQREWERDYPDCAPAILEVVKLCKDVNRRNFTRYARDYCVKLKGVPKNVITQALSIYQKKTELENNAPHPNYFIATCLRLNKEIHARVGEEQDEPFIILGRLI